MGQPYLFLAYIKDAVSLMLDNRTRALESGFVQSESGVVVEPELCCQCSCGVAVGVESQS